MNVEEALAHLDAVLPQACLSKLQITIFREVWAEHSYHEIAKNCGYGLSHVKQTGSELWQLLSQNLGEKVTKNNLQTVLKRHAHTSLKSLATVSVDAQSPIFSSDTQYDWGEAVDIPYFLGREQELQTLARWIRQAGCRLVGVFGMGGMGKTALSIRLAQQLGHSDKATELGAPFEWIIWRSLRNAPPLSHLLEDLIGVLAPNQVVDFPPAAGAQIRCFIELIKAHRCLIVLDNLESVMQPYDCAGSFQPGYEAYGDLLTRIGEIRHPSCVVLTSREKPSGFSLGEGQTLPVRSLQLSGLDPDSIQALLSRRGQFLGTLGDWQQLVSHYGGNPLAIKMASTAITDLFGGDVSQFLTFLQESSGVYGDIRDLLTNQFDRLTSLERDILYWLAINREPITLQDLRQDLVPQSSAPSLLEALASLEHRFFLDHVASQEGPTAQRVSLFTLQPVVMEYVISRLIGNVSHSLATVAPTELPSAPSLLHTHALMKAQAKDYVRESQQRLIVQPIADRLLHSLGLHLADRRLMALITSVRGQPRQRSGYLAGNVINLLNQLGVDWCDRDFSDLIICQAYLKGLTLHRVNLAGSDLSQSVFTEAFSPVLDVAFSPDGTLLAASDVSHEIHLWQVATQQPVFTLKAEDGWSWSVAFSPDNQLLASSATRFVSLWDTATGECVRTLEGYSSRIFAVTFCLGGTYLASGSEDQLLRIWNVATGELVHTLSGHQDEVRTVACHPNGHLLATAGFDGTIRLWNARSGECLAITETVGTKIYALAFSADGKTLASGSDRDLILWRLVDPQLPRLESQHSLSGHVGAIRAIAFSADGTSLASGGDDRTIRLWETSTGKFLRLLQGHTSWVSSLAFAPDSALLASGGEDQSVRLWHSHTATCLHNLQGYSNGIWSVAYSPQGHQFVSGGQDRTVRLWDSATGRCLQAMTGHKSWVWSVAFSPQGDRLASSSDDRSIRLWDTQGRCLHQLQGHTDQVYSIAFSPASPQDAPPCLASGSLDGTIRLWNPDSGECQDILQGHSKGVWSVTFHPQGALLASGSLDQTIKLWQLHPPQPHSTSGQSSRLLKTLTGHRSWVRCVAFSPNGEMLASASADGCLNLWSVKTGQRLHIIQAHPSAILCIAFSPDGSTLASSGIDTTIKIWNLKCLEQSGAKTGLVQADHSEFRLAPQSPMLKTLVGHEKWVRCLAYSPDSQHLISCGQDETIKRWDVEAGECLRTLRMPRPYEGLNICNVQGVSSAQQKILESLGAMN